MIHAFALDLYGFLSQDFSLLSSVAVILGAVFVAYQIRENNKLIIASEKQAEAAASQAKLTTEQTKQNNDIANMDMIMRLYEFANSAEVQSAWLTVLNSRISSYDEFEKLPKQDQVSFLQIAALFESLGVLVARGMVKSDIIEDMFATELAWSVMQPYITGARNKFGDDQNYVFFEKLYEKIKETPPTGTFLTKQPANL